MTLRQSLHIIGSNACNCEVLRSPHALQGAEALERYLTGPCDKLKEICDFFFIKCLQDLEQPDTLFGVLCVPVVVCMFLQVNQIEVGKSRDE